MAAANAVVLAERSGIVTTTPGNAWWRGAAIYEIYPRSFADASSDGTGDLAGVRAQLPYLRDLGVDAVWFKVEQHALVRFDACWEGEGAPPQRGDAPSW